MGVVISTLKIEYHTTALALYSVQLSQDQQITEVTNPRRLETRFRSPQLDRLRSFLILSGCSHCADRNRPHGRTRASSSRWHDNFPCRSLAQLASKPEFVTLRLPLARGGILVRPPGKGHSGRPERPSRPSSTALAPTDWR